MDLILPDKPNVKADIWPHPLTAEQRYATTVYAAPDTPLVRLLGDLLPGVPPAELTVMLNGRLVAPGEMALARVQPDDVLTVRARLQGGDTNPINIILTIAVLALSFYVPGALGLTGFSAGLLSAGITIVGGLIVNALFPVEPPDAPDDGQKPGQQYSISGGANRPRPYEPVLMTLGEHRVFPDLAAVEYVEFIGGEQYLNQVFDFGVGNLDISDLRIGDTPLGSFDRKAAPSTHTVPHNVQGFGTIYTQWTGYTGANALAAVEQQLALHGEPITLVAGDVDTLAGVPLEDTSPVARTGSERAYQLGFDFVARLVRYNKKGKPRSQSVTVKIEYRLADSSDSWTSKNVTLTGSSAEPVRHTETIEVDTDPDPQQWEVRVSRTTAPSSDTRTVDDVAWTALRTYQVAEADATGRTRLALRIRASGQLNSRIARLSALVRNLAPTWDGSAWGDPARSSNPADILRWFARGVYAEGRLVGGLGLADARIDHAALQAWRTWCDTNGLTCNLVIDRGMSVVEVMTVIARCGRASLTWQTGKLGVVYNQENRPHSAMVTPANVIAGSFAVDYPDGRLADEIVTRYVDPKFDWQYAELRRLGNGVTAPTRTATVTLQGVTSRDQAKEETNLIAARQQYHKRRLSWEMGPEGQTLPRGDVANVSHDLISGGVTGRLIGGTASVPGLSTDITISENKDYLEFRLADGTLHVTEVQHEDGATATGETDTPTLLTPLPGAPDNGGLAAKADPGVQAEDVLWRFYSGEKTPNRVKIIEVVPQSTERFRFVGIDDVPEYYAAKDLALTDPLPINRYRFPAVVDMQVSENPIEVGGGFAAEIVVTLTVAGDWRGGVIQAQLNDEAVRTVATLSGGETRASWIDQPTGTLTITAVPGSEIAPTGPALTVTYIIGGDNLAPEEPLNLGASGLPGGYAVSWDVPTEPDYAATEIRESATDETDADNATPRAEVTGTQFTRLGLTGTDELKIWVRHRDHSGNTSDWETVTVTPQELKEGADGTDGGEYEYVFCARATAAAITGAANLPDPDWNFNIPGLATANGVTRGQNKYYDGTPANLGPDRPYVVRFKRRVQGFPAANANIGTVAWEQEPAYRQWGRGALPGAGRILVYNDQESGSLTAAGQYKFSNAAAFSGNSVITPASVKAAAYLYVHQQDAVGTDQSHYYDEVQAGDVVVWFDDNDFWLEWFITAKQKTGDVYRFALTFVESIEEAAHNLADGNVDLRFSRAPAGLDGADGGEYEYVFCARATAAAITGAANLPDPDWNFNIPGLATANGVTRGQNKYYDGTPKDLDGTRPYVVRFKRRVQGFPAANADIGTVAWEQEKAYRQWGRDGRAGVAGIRGLTGYIKRIVLGTFESSISAVNADKDWHMPSADIPANGWTARNVDFYFRTDDDADKALFNFLETGALVTLYIDENNWADYEFGGISFGNDRYHISGMTLVESVGSLATDGAMEIRLTAANVVYRNLWSGTAVVPLDPLLTTNASTPFEIDLPDDIDIDNFDHIVATAYLDGHISIEMLVETMYEVGDTITLSEVFSGLSVLAGNPAVPSSVYYVRIFKTAGRDALRIIGSYPSGSTKRSFQLFSIDAVKKSLAAGEQEIVVPAAAQLTLDDSGTVQIQEGKSRAFGFSIGKAVSASVDVACRLTGSGAGSDVSFAYRRSDTIEQVTIRAGNTDGSVTVYANHSDASDNTTLTVSTTNTLIEAGHRSDSVVIDPVAGPTEVSLDLQQSGTITIDEGDSETFTYALSEAVASAVNLTATLSGSGAGSALSFSSSGSSTRLTRTIPANRTTGPDITVYARSDSDEVDETVTLTIATTSSEVADQSDSVSVRAVDDDGPVYEATLTTGLGGYQGAADNQWVSGYGRRRSSIGGFNIQAYGSLSVSDSDTEVDVEEIRSGKARPSSDGFQGSVQVFMPRNTPNSNATFSRMVLTNGSDTLSLNRSAATYTASFRASNWNVDRSSYARWVWRGVDDDNDIFPYSTSGDTVTVEFYR